MFQLRVEFSKYFLIKSKDSLVIIQLIQLLEVFAKDFYQ